MLDERVRRVVKLPESKDPARSDLERMLSIMFAYRECRFLRGLGCERERKNDLHGTGDEVLQGKLRIHTRSHLSGRALGLQSRRSSESMNSGSRGIFWKESVASVGKVLYRAKWFEFVFPILDGHTRVYITIHPDDSSQL